MPKHTPVDLIDYAFNKASERFFQLAHENLRLAALSPMARSLDPSLLARIVLAQTGAKILAGLQEDPAMKDTADTIGHSFDVIYA